MTSSVFSTPSDSSKEDFSPKTILQFFRAPNWKTTVILLYATFALTFWKYIPTESGPVPVIPDSRGGIIETSGFPSNEGLEGMENPSSDNLPSEPIPSLSLSSDHSLMTFLYGERKVFAAFLLMGVIPILIVKFLFRENLRDYGLCFGNFLTIRSMVLFTPITIFFGWLASLNPAFRTVYPFNPFLSSATTRELILHFFLYAICYYFAWEFMFRGFLLRGLTPGCGMFAAILIQTLAATMVHYGHPLSEVLGCVGGSIFWGALFFRTKSIYSGFVQHAALGIVLDLFLLIHWG